MFLLDAPIIGSAWLAFVGFLYILTIKLRKSPFDLSYSHHAHQELVKGFHGHLLETGLHAMTNFAPPERKKAPLNLLFRQLQLSRREFPVQEQWESEIVFPGRSLRFSNNPELLQTEVARAFPASSAGFLR